MLCEERLRPDGETKHLAVWHSALFLAFPTCPEGRISLAAIEVTKTVQEHEKDGGFHPISRFSNGSVGGKFRFLFPANPLADRIDQNDHRRRHDQRGQ